MNRGDDRMKWKRESTLARSGRRFPRGALRYGTSQVITRRSRVEVLDLKEHGTEDARRSSGMSLLIVNAFGEGRPDRTSA